MAEGREHEAVANARQRLELQKQAVGERHPEYATGLNQLALLLIMHGDPDRAEPLLREALAIRKEALGERHPDYATNLSSLAGLLWARGDLDGAEPLLRQALEVRWDVLGSTHPKSIASLNSLEQLLRAKQDWEGIERLRGGDAGRAGAVAAASPVVVGDAPATAPTAIEPVRADPVSAPPPAPEPVPPPAPAPVALAEAVATPLEPAPAAPRPPARSDVAESLGREGHARAELGRRLEALAQEFTRVGAQLAREAERWKGGAAVPEEALIGELSACGRQFAALRDDALRLAESLGVPARAEGVTDLHAIGTLLDEIAAVEGRRAQLEAVRGQAFAALDRVLALSSADGKEFAPLATCQATARALRGRIASAPATDLPAEAAALAEGDHPFNGLLVLVEGTDGLSDDIWANSLEAVEREFGKPLSVAVARAKVVAPAAS